MRVGHGPPRDPSRTRGLVLLDEAGQVVEPRLGLGARVRRYEQHVATDADRLVPLHLLDFRGSGIEADLRHLPSGVGRQASELLHPRLKLVHRLDAVGHPLVAVGDHAIQDALAVASHDDRRVRALRRLGPRPDAVEVDVAAVVGGLVLAPDRLHRLDALAHQPEAATRIRPVIQHLLAVPAGAHAKQEPSAGELVERCDLLGGRDWIALDDEADTGADQQALRGGRSGRERDKGIVRVRVLARKLAARRVWGLPLRRDVRVLGKEKRLEAARLRHSRDLGRGDGVVRRKHHHAEVHGSSLTGGAGLPCQTLRMLDERLVKALHVSSLRADELHAEREPHVLFQASTIGALLDGAYEGDVTFAELADHGDLGLGTLNGLDGEMIAVDGRFFRADRNGTVREVDPSQRTPFAVLTWFEPAVGIEVDDPISYDDLLALLDAHLPEGTVACAVQIDGWFESVHARSVPRQEPPYRPLAEVVRTQTVFDLAGVEGTMVGFRFPDYSEGLEVR